MRTYDRTPLRHAGTSAPRPPQLHWAASSDDVDVAAALIDGGADLETPDGCDSGRLIDNAIGYASLGTLPACSWPAVRVRKGVLHAAALGLLHRLDELLAPGLDQEQISQGVLARL